MIRIEFPERKLAEAKETACDLLYDEGVHAAVYLGPEGFLVLDLDGFRREKATLELIYSPERRETSRVPIVAPCERIDAKSA